VDDFDGDAYRAVYTICLGTAVYVLWVCRKKSTHGIRASRLELVRGRLEGFSFERLVRYLLALGHDVEIVIRATNGHGHATRVAGKHDLKPAHVPTLRRCRDGAFSKAGKRREDVPAEIRGIA
jgi:hypothetical protein